LFGGSGFKEIPMRERMKTRMLNRIKLVNCNIDGDESNYYMKWWANLIKILLRRMVKEEKGKESVLV
jgi:hypothetical protein